MSQTAQLFFESQAIWDESHISPILEKLRYAKGDAEQAYRELVEEMDDPDAVTEWQERYADEIADFGVDPDDARKWWRDAYLRKTKERLQGERGPAPGSFDHDLMFGHLNRNPAALSFGRADMSKIDPASAKKFASAARTYTRHLRALAGGDKAAFDLAVAARDRLGKMAWQFGEDGEARGHLHDYVTSLGSVGEAEEQGRAAWSRAHEAERTRLLQEERAERPSPGSYEHELAVGRIRRNPDVRAQAVKKFSEFHRLEPQKITDFPKGFRIPTKMIKVGRAVATMYRSGKVDPSTLKKPRRPIDYIHEHEAGVDCYMPVGDREELEDLDLEHDQVVSVPAEFAKAEALVKLGDSLGVSFQADGDEDPWDIEVSNPLPEVYCTPDGKCLLVIQSRTEVVVMIWGGSLGVFSRGIDG